MKCHDCGFENEDNASFCRQCGVNLRKNDAENFKENINVLNREFKVKHKRRPYPAPFRDSIKAKLMYKQDRRTGRLRLAKTKCAVLVVFSSFFIFSFVISLITYTILESFFIAIIVAVIFSIPTAVIGIILRSVIDKLTANF